MAEQWKVVTFAELVERGILEIGDGYRAKLDELGGSGPIFLRAGLLNDRGIDWATAERFHAELLPRVRSKLSRVGDTIVTTKGNSVGRTGCIPIGAPPLVYSPHLSYWRSLDPSRLSPRFLYYWSRSREFSAQLQAMAGSTDMAPYLSLSDQRRLQVTLPEIRTQNAVAEVMSALDDKIAVNDRIADVGRQLAQAEFQAAVQTKDSVECGLAFVSEFLSRGVTPRYSEDAGQLIVLNQKCIRDGRVSLAPSRWTEKDAVPITKLLRTNDVLVNSTGVGTLGRVARWVYEQPCTVDSHVTIVRFDAAKADPVCAGFAMLAAQPDIEAMGEGSTGQTELGRTRLGEVRLTMPGKTHTERLRPILDALEGRGNAALAESAALADLRDTLLARLMSGEIRVRDAEKIVGDAT